MQRVEKVVTVVRQKAGQVLEAVRDTAFDFSWDVRDAAEGGFGVPYFITSVASFSVAAVAAAGTAAIALDAVGKVFGKRECNRCNGWEGLRCTMCAGKGKVQYHVSNFGLPDGENVTTQSMAAAITGGRAELGHWPASINVGLPLPYRECPTCEGTGVMKCTECKGQAWKAKISFDDVMDVPWKSWDVYRKTQPPTEVIDQSMAHPSTAAWMLFGQDELEHGIRYDADVKQKMWWKYKEGRRYDEIREKVEKREEGWEALQEILGQIDLDRAMKDPVIVRNVPYYKARQKIEAEVNELEIPPRPANWGAVKRPLSESDWSKEDLKDPRKQMEMQTLLQGQEQLIEKMLNYSWADHWRKQQVEEMSKLRIESYIQTKEEEARNPPPAAAATRDVDSVPTSNSSKARPAETKVDSKKRPVDEKKKKERQERADRLAKQADAREASLVKAKAAREKGR